MLEALPIVVVTHFIQWFKDFGLPVRGGEPARPIAKRRRGPHRRHIALMQKLS